VKKLPALAGALALLCAITSQAGAQTYRNAKLSDGHVGKTKAELVAQREHSLHVITFFVVGHPWLRAPRHSTCKAVPWTRTCTRARAQLRAHRWLYSLAKQRYEDLYAPKYVTGHLDGWRCITNGATPRSPHEGNGYNGSYTGRLGMTTPWAGHSPSTGDWVTASEAEVYGVAETEAAKHHWSYDWMSHQWPNTYPPCASHFR
jgi:hypothetical protein